MAGRAGARLPRAPGRAGVLGAPTTRSSSDPGAAALAARLAGQYGAGSAAAAHGGQRYFVGASQQIDAFVLNTHRSLFRDVRLRQAVSAALDRRALAALGGGYQTLPDQPADHFLPPGMAGYREARVYPDTPDLPRARALARGRTGRTAVLYTCDAYACPQQAQIVKTDLAAIGLRVDIHTLPPATMYAREVRPGAAFDLAYTGWVPDYLDPSTSSATAPTRAGTSTRARA